MRVRVVNRVLRKILGLRVRVVNRVLRKILDLSQDGQRGSEEDNGRESPGGQQGSEGDIGA